MREIVEIVIGGDLVSRATLPEPIVKCSACGGERVRIIRGELQACPTCKGHGIVVAYWYDAKSPNGRPEVE